MIKNFHIFFILLILCSCKKEQPIPVNSVQATFTPINATLIPLLFDTNSYWIYSNGNQLDTVTLISLTRQEVSVSPKSLKDETFLFNYHSTLLNNYTESALGAIITRDWTNDGWVYATNLGLGETSGGLSLIEKIDTLIVGNQEYHHVSKMQVQQGSFFLSSMYLYYADSVGVIRREVLSGNSIVDTWDLIQSSILFYPY